EALQKKGIIGQRVDAVIEVESVFARLKTEPVLDIEAKLAVKEAERINLCLCLNNSFIRQFAIRPGVTGKGCCTEAEEAYRQDLDGWAEVFHTQDRLEGGDNTTISNSYGSKFFRKFAPLHVSIKRCHTLLMTPDPLEIRHLSYF